MSDFEMEFLLHETKKNGIILKTLFSETILIISDHEI